MEPAATARPGGPRRVAFSLILATMVNPLNSTMLAIGLVTIAAAFHTTVGATTALVVAFYATGAVAQPLMGRLADGFGPRRVMRGGLAVALVVSVAAANAPNLALLILCRALLALGTSAAYPAAMAMLRQSQGLEDRTPTATITGLSIGASLSTMLGPPLSGLLIVLGGWPALFWFNVPLIAAVLVMSWAWHPPDRPRRAGLLRPPIDRLGLLLFAAVIASLYAATYTSGGGLALALAALVAFLVALYRYESRRPGALIDVTLLARNRRLRNVYASFVGFTLIWYAFAVGLPIWLQAAYGLSPGHAGLLMLPTAVASVLVAPLAARLTDRGGARVATVVGLALLLATCLSLATYGSGTTLAQLLLTGLAAGAAGAMLNVAYQVRLYEASPADGLGAAAGLYQSFRYVGAILSAALVAATLGEVDAGTTLAATAGAMTAICLAVIGLDLHQRLRSRTSPPIRSPPTSPG